jgi:hypothetical protein
MTAALGDASDTMMADPFAAGRGSRAASRPAVTCPRAGCSVGKPPMSSINMPR